MIPSHIHTLVLALRFVGRVHWDDRAFGLTGPGATGGTKVSIDLSGLLWSSFQLSDHQLLRINGRFVLTSSLYRPYGQFSRRSKIHNIFYEGEGGKC